MWESVVPPITAALVVLMSEHKSQDRKALWEFAVPLPWNCMSSNIQLVYTMSDNPLTSWRMRPLLWRDHIVVLCLCSHLWFGTKGQYDGCSHRCAQYKRIRH